MATNTLFTLPNAYRPAYTKFLPVAVVTSGGTSGLGELWVYSDGNVELWTYIGAIQYARFSDAIFTLY